MVREITKKAIRIAFTGFVGATILIVSSEALRTTLASQAAGIQVAQAPIPNVTGNCNNFGNNNTNCNVFNLGPQRLRFSDEVGSDLLAKIPNKNKPVLIRSVGGTTDQTVGTEIQGFLVRNGYKVSRTSITMLIPPPDNKLSLAESADGYVLTVAPSAN